MTESNKSRIQTLKGKVEDALKRRAEQAKLAERLDKALDRVGLVRKSKLPQPVEAQPPAAAA